MGFWKTTEEYKLAKAISRKYEVVIYYTSASFIWLVNDIELRQSMSGKGIAGTMPRKKLLWLCEG